MVNTLRRWRIARAPPAPQRGSLRSAGAVRRRRVERVLGEGRIGGGADERCHAVRRRARRETEAYGPETLPG